jgi:hypothetical protein
MKANTRRVPSSTRSRSTRLPRSPTRPWRFPALCEKCVHYAYKMRPNFKTQILIHSTPTTYVFDLQKCTHFRVTCSALVVDKHRIGCQTDDNRILATNKCHPLSLGEGARVRDKLVTLGFRWPRGSNRSYTVYMPSQNRIKPNRNARALHKLCQRARHLAACTKMNTRGGGGCSFFSKRNRTSLRRQRLLGGASSVEPLTVSALPVLRLPCLSLVPYRIRAHSRSFVVATRDPENEKK